MLTTTDILLAMSLKLKELWPDRPAYAEVCPVDFSRPSSWLQVQSHEPVDAGRFVQKHTAVFLLTLYDELDDHYEANWQRLSQDTDAVMRLLTPPLKVVDRHIVLTMKRLPRNPDEAQVQMTAVWMDEMPGTSGDNTPVADSYELNVRVVMK